MNSNINRNINNNTGFRSRAIAPRLYDCTINGIKVMTIFIPTDDAVLAGELLKSIGKLMLNAKL